MPVTLDAALSVAVSPTTGQFIDMPVGMPTLVSVGEPGQQLHALDSDGMMIHLDPTQPVELNMTVDHPGDTLYDFELLELLPDVSNNVQLVPRFAVACTGPDQLVPPDAFVIGHTYTLQAVTVSGSFPNLATGDLSARALPMSFGLLKSGVFTVTP
jgi:hypothetical protein